MPRVRKPSLRGSVMQQRPSVRLRAEDSSPLRVLMRFGLLAGSLLLMVGLGFWLWHIGWPQRQTERALDGMLSLTQKAHFAVTDIEVEGRQQTSREALSEALGTTAGLPILSFDATAAQARILKLPWVASAIVERRLPDTIRVKLVERVPLARWQHDGRTVVIDTTGKELMDAKPEVFTGLPLLVGAGASAEAEPFLKTMHDFPAVAEKMTAAVWVGLRRWDIYLAPKIVAKMPEGNLSTGLKRLADLITEKHILERDIVTIDLRFADRIIMESATPGSDHSTGESHL